MFCKVLLGYLALTQAVVDANSFAEVSVEGNNYITWMSGKWRVPSLPDRTTRGSNLGPFYLWPALDPYSECGGFWQPVLGVADLAGDRWSMANTYKASGGGYQTGPQTPCSVGDEIYWWIESKGGGQYNMGFEVNGVVGHEMTHGCTNGGMPKRAWLAEVEIYGDLSQSPYLHQYLPRSDWISYDVQVLDMYKRPVTTGRRCSPDSEVPMSCDFDAGRFTASFGGGGGGSCQDTPGQPCAYYKLHGYCRSSASVKAACKATCGLCASLASTPEVNNTEIVVV